MSTIQYNISEKERLLSILEEHPLCFDIKTIGKKLIITFPYTACGLHGLRVDNNRYGINQAIEKLETLWKDL